MTNQQVINKYIKDLRRDKIVKNTINNYIAHITEFDTLTNKDFKDINIDDINKYKEFLVVEKGNIESTVNTKLRSLKAFINYLIYIDVLENFKKIKMLKEPKDSFAKDKAITLGEQRKLLEYLESLPNGFENVRKRMMFKLLMFCGIRKDELFNIQISNIDLDNAMITIIGKGNKKRTLGLNETTMFSIKQWLAYYRPECDNDHLIVSSKGKIITSQRTLNNTWDNIQSKLGIEIHRTVHNFRHGFCRMMYKAGKTIFEISIMMGHSDVSITAKNYFGMTQYEQADLFKQNILVMEG